VCLFGLQDRCAAFLLNIVGARNKYLIRKNNASRVVSYIRRFPGCALLFLGYFLPGRGY